MIDWNFYFNSAGGMISNYIHIRFRRTKIVWKIISILLPELTIHKICFIYVLNNINALLDIFNHQSWRFFILALAFNQFFKLFFYFPVLKKFRSLGLGQVRPTLTEENGIFTLEAFPQNFSSDEEFSPYQRRKPRKTQKVAESDIKSQSNFDQLFDSGTIQGKVNLLNLFCFK